MAGGVAVLLEAAPAARSAVKPGEAAVVTTAHALGGQEENKPIQDGGEAKAPMWLNRLSGTD